MVCLHDPANVQQTSSKCIQNTRANAGRLLDICWKFAGRLLLYVIMAEPARCLLDVCWKFAGRLLDDVNTLLDNSINLALVTCEQATLSKLLTHCKPRPTQPLTLSGLRNE